MFAVQGGPEEIWFRPCRSLIRVCLEIESIKSAGGIYSHNTICSSKYFILLQFFLGKPLT